MSLRNLKAGPYRVVGVTEVERRRYNYTDRIYNGATVYITGTIRGGGELLLDNYKYNTSNIYIYQGHIAPLSPIWLK